MSIYLGYRLRNRFVCFRGLRPSRRPRTLCNISIESHTIVDMAHSRLDAGLEQTGMRSNQTT